MVRQPKNRARRSGAVTVEFALGAALFFFFLFGVVEFGRLVVMYNALENATREAARWACVRTNIDPTVYPTQAARNQAVRDIFMNYLGELKDSYDTNSVQMEIVRVIMIPQPGDPPAGTTYPDWDNARTTDAIRITATANFRTVLPNFLLFGNTIPMQCISVMYSEAN
ncbi:MAG TPA: TadE/TadG family type IV pilus assembly protein [Gemmatales bacterium]|nr:TadE/TadG family type IV pilus assembly protein [Gemmatales bacterium]HMP59963.1 TadE/TadG family type IV pilus assembly protein [Gemmatales bacterium]